VRLGTGLCCGDGGAARWLLARLARGATSAAHLPLAWRVLVGRRRPRLHGSNAGDQGRKGGAPAGALPRRAGSSTRRRLAVTSLLRAGKHAGGAPATAAAAMSGGRARCARGNGVQRHGAPVSTAQ
jgi:hypothetical protein